MIKQIDYLCFLCFLRIIFCFFRKNATSQLILRILLTTFVGFVRITVKNWSDNMKIAYTHTNIITVNEQFDIFKDGLLITEEDKIVYVGSFDQTQLDSCDRVENYNGSWIMPGLVNIHTHTTMTFLRGIQDDANLYEWLNNYIWPAEAKFTDEHTTLAVKAALVEMLKSGTTTFNDMYNPQGVNIDRIYQVVKASHMRCYFSPTFFSNSNETTDETIVRTRAIIEKIRSYNNDRFRVMIAPHSPYSCSKELLEKSLILAKELNVPIHIHVAETDTENQVIINRFGKRPLAYLADLGYLDHPAVFAHGVKLNKKEIKQLAKFPIAVAHNPLSNLKLASGICPVVEMLKQGVTVGLATDSTASNNNLDLFEEIRTATVLQKMAHKDASQMNLEMAFRLMTIDGARALGMEDQIGSLEVGKQADFIAINPDCKIHLYPQDKMLSHLIYSAKGSDVDDVYIAGICVMKNQVVQTISEASLFKELTHLNQMMQKNGPMSNGVSDKNLSDCINR